MDLEIRSIAIVALVAFVVVLATRKFPSIVDSML
jgi:Sec-independent protein translocase protein TatA